MNYINILSLDSIELDEMDAQDYEYEIRQAIKTSLVDGWGISGRYELDELWLKLSQVTLAIKDSETDLDNIDEKVAKVAKTNELKKLRVEKDAIQQLIVIAAKREVA